MYFYKPWRYLFENESLRRTYSGVSGKWCLRSRNPCLSFVALQQLTLAYVTHVRVQDSGPEKACEIRYRKWDGTCVVRVFRVWSLVCVRLKFLAAFQIFHVSSNGSELIFHHFIPKTRNTLECLLVNLVRLMLSSRLSPHMPLWEVTSAKLHRLPAMAQDLRNNSARYSPWIGGVLCLTSLTPYGSLLLFC